MSKFQLALNKQRDKVDPSSIEPTLDSNNDFDNKTQNILDSTHDQTEEGWVLYYSPEGYPYYYNVLTGESHWADYEDQDQQPTELYHHEGNLESHSQSRSQSDASESSVNSNSEDDDPLIYSIRSAEPIKSTNFDYQFESFLNSPEGQAMLEAERYAVERKVFLSQQQRERREKRRKGRLKLSSSSFSFHRHQKEEEEEEEEEEEDADNEDEGMNRKSHRSRRNKYQIYREDKDKEEEDDDDGDENVDDDGDEEVGRQTRGGRRGRGERDESVQDGEGVLQSLVQAVYFAVGLGGQGKVEKSVRDQLSKRGRDNKERDEERNEERDEKEEEKEENDEKAGVGSRSSDDESESDDSLSSEDSDIQEMILPLFPPSLSDLIHHLLSRPLWFLSSNPLTPPSHPSSHPSSHPHPSSTSSTSSSFSSSSLWSSLSSFLSPSLHWLHLTLLSLTEPPSPSPPLILSPSPLLSPASFSSLNSTSTSPSSYPSNDYSTLPPPPPSLSSSSSSPSPSPRSSTLISFFSPPHSTSHSHSPSHSSPHSATLLSFSALEDEL